MIIHAVSQQAIGAVNEVTDRCSPGFIDKVKWLITDRRGLPITPFVHHPFQFVLATRGPPETASTGMPRSSLTTAQVSGPRRRPANRTSHSSSVGCESNCDTLKTIHPEVAVAHEIAREQLMRPPPSQPAQDASQNPASSRASLKRPRSDDEEPPSGPKRRYSPRLAARSRAGTASMSPLVNELGGTEDVGAPDVLSGLMEVDDSNGEEDALFDPMEIDNNKDENGRGRGRKWTWAMEESRDRIVKRT